MIEVKTLTKIPFGISWLLLIPLSSLVFVVMGFKANYLISSIIVITTSYFLFKIFTGKLLIDYKTEEGKIIFIWLKKTPFTKFDNQKISIEEITGYKHLRGRAADTVKLKLKSGKNITIDFNNLISLTKNQKKMYNFLDFFRINNITKL